MILYWNSKRAILQVAKRDKIIPCLKMCKNALIKKFVLYWKIIFIYALHTNVIVVLVVIRCN